MRFGSERPLVKNTMENKQQKQLLREEVRKGGVHFCCFFVSTAIVYHTYWEQILLLLRICVWV